MNRKRTFIIFSLGIFSLNAIFLAFAGYFEIGLLSDDYLNFVAAENSSIVQKFTSSVPYYSNLHFRPLWFLSINLIIFLNGLLNFSYDNFFLFRLENLLYLYTVIFLSSFLLFTITNRVLLSLLFNLMCLAHPNFLNSICWTIGKVDLLCGIFIFCAFLFTFNYIKNKSSTNFIIVILFFLSALLTKETSVIVPFITALLIITVYGKSKLGSVKNLLLVEFIILSFYFIYKILLIGNSPFMMISVYKDPVFSNAMGVLFRAFISLTIPLDYLSIERYFRTQNIIFILYIVLMSALLILIILKAIRKKLTISLISLLLVFLITLMPNIIGGYFRPQLILIPFLILNLFLFIVIFRNDHTFIQYKPTKIILGIIIIFWMVSSFQLIQDWKYASNHSLSTIKNLIAFNLNPLKKNIIIGLQSRLRQAYMTEYAIGPYNYFKYKQFNITDNIFDLVHTGGLDINSLQSELSIKKVGDAHYEISTSSENQYFYNLDPATNDYRDEDIEVDLAGKNYLNKSTMIKIKVLSENVDVYIFTKNKFLLLSKI